tara:strand:- start:7116 stop:10706 length:3591 start_codon:yes stop_codon:yes gene_type:complete
MAREKLKDFLRGVSSKDSLSYVVDPTLGGDAKDIDVGDDLGVDPGSGKRLVQLNVEGVGESLVNDFLNFLTEAVNYYKIQGGSSRAITLSKVSESGVGTALQSSTQQGADSVFIDSNDTSLQYSNGNLPKLSNIISKLGDIDPSKEPVKKKERRPRSGHTLLQSLPSSKIDRTGKTFAQTKGFEDKPANIAIETTFLTRNRFRNNSAPSQRSAFYPQGTASGDQVKDLESGKKGSGTRTSQTTYGDYQISAPIMINDELRKVAGSIMLKSLGLDNGENPGESLNPDAFDYESAKVKNVASKKVLPDTSKGNVRARSALGAPHFSSGDSTRGDRGAFEEAASTSYGSDYTPDLSFTGAKNKAIIRLRAAATIIAMVEILDDLVDRLDANRKSIVAGAKDSKISDLGRGPYFPGQTSMLARTAKLDFLMSSIMVPTVYSYGKCVERGVEVVFGSEMSKPMNDKVVGRYQGVAESPGFWYAVSRSVLKKNALLQNKISNGEESYESDPTVIIGQTLAGIADAEMIGVLNSFASIGDKSLQMTGGASFDSSDAVSPLNVDSLPDGPSTRVSKSRSQSGLTSLSLAWRGNALPALYLVPRNVIAASQNMNTYAAGGNPIKGHTSSDLAKKSFININGENQSARIPIDVVRGVENVLDAEYVPFYFHDVRTNEIISFHAFLSSMTDRYTANYSESRGYGRVDPVKVYRNTTRNISLTFYAAATSKEDFDEMWFKINKLTTLVYPQWTKGTKMTTAAEDKFIQPFSQVISATPLTRLRVGDVIKSNYSRFNLSRTFGMGERDTVITDESFGGSPIGLGSAGLVRFGATMTGIGRFIQDLQLDIVFKILFGSPLALLGSGDAGATTLDRIMRGLLAQLTLNGFVNPLGIGPVLKQLQSPDVDANNIPELNSGMLSSLESARSSLLGAIAPNLEVGYKIGNEAMLKASPASGYITGGGTKIRTTRTMMVTVLKIDREDFQNPATKHTSDAARGPSRKGNPRGKVVYVVEISDINAPANVSGASLRVHHEDLLPDPNQIFRRNVLPFMDIIGAGVELLQSKLINKGASFTGLPADTLSLISNNYMEFMHPANNSITRAFENSGGRGLSGVIDSMSFDWVDPTTTWEIDWNSRAPMWCKISIAFKVIHDIPPGIDDSGYNRAPIYNVGDIMAAISGDPHPDHGSLSKDAFVQSTRFSTQALDKDKIK